MFVVGSILAIKFFVASAEEKAKVKESLVPYFVGCAVVVGAFTIWDIVVNIGQDITNNTNVQTEGLSTFVFYVTQGRAGTIGQEAIVCDNADQLRSAINRYSSVSFAAQGQSVDVEFENPQSGVRRRISLQEFKEGRDGNSMYDYFLQYLG